MKTQMTRFTLGRRLLCGMLLMLATLAGTASAQDGHKIWTSVASAGTVDESDVSEIAFAGPFATFGPAAPAVSRANHSLQCRGGGRAVRTSGAVSWPR